MEDRNKLFAGKVILVTGSSSGIGEATAKLFASLGGKVTVTGRNVENLKKVAEECRKLSPTKEKIVEVVADVSNEDDCKRIIDTTIKEFGKLDVLVNNAGIGAVTSLDDQNMLTEFDKLMKINVRSVVVMTQLALPHLEKTKGSIVNVSSVASIKAHKTFFGYCMSKSSIDMFTKCIAVDLGPKQIRVNAVNPAVIITPIFERSFNFKEKQMQELEKECINNYPLKRSGKPQEVAEAIAYLASDKASFITGVTLEIDGGSMFTSTGCATLFD